MLGSLQDHDIKLLRMFYVIAQCRGFSAAQAQLNLSQSAISTRMAQLEARLGCRLCERGRGAFKLTNHGKAVLRASEKLFGALEDFREEVAESQGQLTGELRLGLIDNSVTHDNSIIQDAIAGFARLAPEARVRIYVGDAIELEQQVLDERLHLGIGLFHHRLELLDYTPLFNEENVLYCSRSHEFFELDDRDISAEKLKEARYASWGHGENLPDWQPPFSLSEVASSPYIEGVAHLILSGCYIGYLPTHYADIWVRRRLMRPLFPGKSLRSAEFSLIRRKSARISRLMNGFLQQLGIDDADAA